MKTYRIYTCQDRVPVLVKRGFSWPAFFFSWMWALFSGLFLYAFLMIVAISFITNLSGVIVAANTYNEMLAGTAQLIAAIGALTVIGVYANDLRVRNLIKKGYAQYGTVEAPNLSEAIRKLESTAPASDEQKGIDEAASLESTEPWQCSGCSEQIDGQFSSCWKCGTDRSGRS